MKKINKRKIVYLIIFVGMFGLGMLFQYYLENSKTAAEVEQLKDKIELAKENNEQLEREIINLHKEIEKYVEEESSDTKVDDSDINTSDQTNSSDSSNVAEEQANTSDSSNTIEEQVNNEYDSSNTAEEQTAQDSHFQDGEASDELLNQEKAIDLVKEYIGYSNESNVHFEVQGKESGTEDFSIHVYEIVVDEGEGQHTATWGWYGANVTTGNVYEING